MLRIPLGKPVGKVYYTVESKLDPISFTKKKDAESLRDLLARSTNAIEATIVRREITEEGFIPTYGEKHVKKH